MLGALIALFCLCADGEAGAEVYSVAGSAAQARLVFVEALRMIELGPLSGSLKTYRNEIVHPASGSRYKAVAADAGNLEGLNPSCVIFDEVHVQGSDRRLWDVMQLGSGAREHPLMLGITTPGVRYGSDGQDSLAFTMYDYGKRIVSGEIDDPAFFFRVWEPPADSSIDDEDAWKIANPGLGDFLSIEDMRAARKTTPENEFKTKRLGQWVNAQAAWLPAGSWEALEAAPIPERGTRVVLGFDGSRNRDTTALVGATIEPNPQVFLIQAWERPMFGAHDWQVPRDDVSKTVLESCQEWNVAELVSDPALWISELQEWEQARVPVVEFPQSPSRMVPATQLFFEAVKTESMRHDGDPLLARHLNNAVIKPTGQIAKEHKGSGRKIDAAVAAIMAYSRAHTLGNQPTNEFVFFMV